MVVLQSLSTFKHQVHIKDNLLLFFCFSICTHVGGFNQRIQRATRQPVFFSLFALSFHYVLFSVCTGCHHRCLSKDMLAVLVSLNLGRDRMQPHSLIVFERFCFLNKTPLLQDRITWCIRERFFWEKRTFKGTVSRDEFCFWGHAWSVLCLNMGRGQFLNFQVLQWFYIAKNVFFFSGFYEFVLAAACT